MADPTRAPTRPLPRLEELDTQHFWRATKQHRLEYQRCDDCGSVVFYPRSHCTSCLGRSLSWHASKGLGTVYSYSVIRQSYHPFFKARVPFAVAWIDLDEGPRVLSNLTGVADPSRDVRIGQRVAIEWEDHEELAIPLFKPVT